MDKLTDCKRCNSNACYEQHINEQLTTWLCMGCGFTTSTVMTEGSQPVKQAIESSPELYKDLLHKDEDGHIWMPATVTLPAKGMVFIDGSTKENWRWAAVKAVEIVKEEKHKYPDGQTHKMDMKGAQYFNQKEFMDALEVIGFYQMQ
jgi:hypothetical protein